MGDLRIATLGPEFGGGFLTIFRRGGETQFRTTFWLHRAPIIPMLVIPSLGLRLWGGVAVKE